MCTLVYLTEEKKLLNITQINFEQLYYISENSNDITKTFIK